MIGTPWHNMIPVKIISSEMVDDESENGRWKYTVRVVKYGSSVEDVPEVPTIPEPPQGPGQGGGPEELKAYNLYEYANTTTSHMGIDPDDLPGTYELKPIPNNTIVPAFFAAGRANDSKATKGLMVMILWPNQFDGGCEDGEGLTGGSSTSYGERPDATTVRLFTDHLFDGPDGRNSGADFVKFGGSSTQSTSETVSGGQGVTGVYVNGSNDRGTYWGPELYPSGDEAVNSGFLWECRCMYPSTWSAGHVNIGVYGTDNVVDYNDQPPGIGYTTSIYAGISINQSETYWQKVKHETLSGSNATATSLTPEVTAFDDTWVRIGISGLWDTTNSRWNLRYFKDGVEIGTDTLAVVGGLGVGYIGCGVGTYSSPGWRMYVDWISLQYTRSANLVLLDIGSLP